MSAGVMTLGELGVQGSDEKRFGRPTDIDWLPDGTFFISDGYINTRVVKFDRNGTFLMAWGTPSKGRPNPGPNEFDTVHSVAVGKDRRVYVSDRTNSRIQVFDENGKFLYVAEVFNGRAQKFRPKKGADPAKLVSPELRWPGTN